MSENQYEPKFVHDGEDEADHEALRAAERLAEEQEQGAHRAEQQRGLQGIRHGSILRVDQTRPATFRRVPAVAVADGRIIVA